MRLAVDNGDQGRAKLFTKSTRNVEETTDTEEYKRQVRQSKDELRFTFIHGRNQKSDQ